MYLYCKVRQKFIDTYDWEGFRDMFISPPYNMDEEEVIDMFFDTVCIFANVVEDKEEMDSKKIKIEDITVVKMRDLIDQFNDEKVKDAKKTK